MPRRSPPRPASYPALRSLVHCLMRLAGTSAQMRCAVRAAAPCSQPFSPSQYANPGVFARSNSARQYAIRAAASGSERWPASNNIVCARDRSRKRAPRAHRTATKRRAAGHGCRTCAASMPGAAPMPPDNHPRSRRRPTKGRARGPCSWSAEIRPRRSRARGIWLVVIEGLLLLALWSGSDRLDWFVQYPEFCKGAHIRKLASGLVG